MSDLPLWDVFGEDIERLEKLHACSGDSCQVCAGDRVDLPYAGTSGWSGSDTSRTRAVTADASGQTRERQHKVLALLAEVEDRGLTWAELGDKLGAHHGTASGVLSVLHKAGRIDRLTERRDRCKVYVLPEFTAGREIEVHGRKHECPSCGHRF